MAHKYSTELLLHILCSKCTVWWSFASPDNYVPTVMFCPHCGQKDKLEKKD